MRVAGEFIRLVALAIALLALVATAPPADHGRADLKLDAILRERARVPRGASRVIVQATEGRRVDDLIRALGGTPDTTLRLASGQVATVPDAALRQLARSAEVASIRLDRPTHGTMDRAAGVVGARWVQDHLGLDGNGIGIATIDSGITAWHEDLAGRMVHFADFVNLQPVAYDDYGHGTHVAGIIAGSGQASTGARRGIASGANLIVLKALDAAGGGHISHVIAALEYAVANRDLFNIRVINLSVAATVQESCYDDPLALAARRAVEAGIVVVAAAGNRGQSSLGRPQYGGITAPGNAPWVLTVGASSQPDTLDRRADVVARFSSRGPSAVDLTAKPDLVAPGVGIASTTEPSSALFAAHPGSRLEGTFESHSEPYLRLSGTSMAAPIVAGTVALMLEANPALTPNAVKAILQFTADPRIGYDHLTQGAGFLDTRAAVELARAFSSRNEPGGPEATGDRRPGRRIIWGNLVVPLSGLSETANAWARDVVWGASATPGGEPITFARPCDPRRADCVSRMPCDSGAPDCGPPAGTLQNDDTSSSSCDRADCVAGPASAAAEREEDLRRVEAAAMPAAADRRTLR